MSQRLILGLISHSRKEDKLDDIDLRHVKVNCGHYTNPRKDGPTGIKVLAYRDWVQLRPRLIQMRGGRSRTLFRIDCRWNRIISDVISSSVVYFGLRLAIKPPDKEHPYGHGKAEPIAAVMVSLTLVAAAIMIAIESVHRIQTRILSHMHLRCGFCLL
jgi:hypothetical protein